MELTRAEIEREADDHIALGLLLGKVREEPKRSAVQKVLANPLTIPQKIEKIKEIDEKEDTLAILHVVRQASAQVARSQVSRISRMIKKTTQSCSYFKFIFTEYRRVREFGRRSYVLETRLLPPGIRIDPQLPAFLAKEILTTAAELSLRLNPVVEHGWLHLTPRQYNLLVLLKRLADRLRAIEFAQLNLRDLNVIDRLRRVESLFLMLHYEPDTQAVIFGALRAFYEKQHEPEEENDKTNRLVLRILAEDCTLPSLYNCLLGLNIFKYRRLLTLADLMREGLGEMVDSRAFDCESPVRARMDGYIDAAFESIGKLHEQLLEARRINSYIVLDEQGRPDTEILAGFYAPGDSREPFSFAADQDNLVLFVPRLVRRFDRLFSPLLNGQCLLEETGRTAIFSRAFFELDFTKLRTMVEKMETGPFHFSSFPLSRYLQIKGARLGAIGNEMEVNEIIGQGVGCLVDLGKTLMKILVLRTPGGAAGTPEPLEPIVLQGKTFSLPHENGRIQTRSLLKGKTVVEALSLAVTICFTAGLLLHDDFLSLFLGKEKRLGAELRARMKLMENLLDPESYRELSGLYV
ncbi:MAG: hypothetical protein ABSB63_22950 [Spirochaetia bacterium]